MTLAELLTRIAVLPESVKLSLLAVPGPGWALDPREVDSVTLHESSSLAGVPTWLGGWAWLPCSEIAIVEAARVKKGAPHWKLDWTGPNVYGYLAILYKTSEFSGDVEVESSFDLSAVRAALSLFCKVNGAEWPEGGAM